MTSSSITTTSAAPGQASSAAQWRYKARYLLISLCVLVLDQWSKWMIEAHVTPYSRHSVIPDLLNFTNVQNTGVAFGLFASKGNLTGTLVLTVLGLAALGFVAYYFSLVPSSDRMLLVALSLVIGGAIGNLLDRIMNGGVTDFIDFYFGSYHWHTFNVADSAISVGIGLMILGTILHREEPALDGAKTAEDDPS